MQEFLIQKEFWIKIILFLLLGHRIYRISPVHKARMALLIFMVIVSQ